MKLHPFLRHYSATIMLISVLSLASLAVYANSSTDWPNWRGPDRNGISDEKGWMGKWPATGPKEIWRVPVGTGYSSVAVSNGRLYTMGNINQEEVIHCLNAETGKMIWERRYPCEGKGNGHPGTTSTPTVDGKMVYTLGREGELFCLDSDSGNVIWNKNVLEDFGAKLPSWHYASSPVILDNMLVIEVGMTLALDKSNGNLIWKTADYGGGYSSVSAFYLNDVQYLAVFNATGLVLLNPKNGQELAQQVWKTSYDVNAVTPIISGDKIFISSGYNVGGALMQTDGKSLSIVWQNKNMRNHFNSCVLWEGYLYGFDESQLRCLDWKTGEVKWTQKGLGKGSLMIADGKIIAMGDKGDLVTAELSPEAYKEISSAKVLSGLCWTVPVLSNGRIYCRNHEGDLICLDVKGDS